jgi:2,3-dihydroxybiphenyl 1,2-dioxygenase
MVGSLAYVGVSTTQMPAWDAFARRVMGIHVDAIPDGRLRLRLDDKLCRFLISPGPVEGAAFFGWELAAGLDLMDVEAELAAAGVACEFGSDAECRDRGAGAFLWFHDPLGNRIELCDRHDDAPPSQPLQFARPISGFKTGALGLGHAVFMSAEVEAARRFYVDILGMRLSDYTAQPFDAHFYHANARHHCLAIIKNRREGLHHIMLELLEMDDVGQTYDILPVEGVALGATLGRHTNDFMTSFYMFTPSGFMIEYGWGGREIEVETWRPEFMDCGPSFWGHDRTWLDDATRQEALDMRLGAAARGLKAKIVVTPGHFTQTSGPETS